MGHRRDATGPVNGSEESLPVGWHVPAATTSLPDTVLRALQASSSAALAGLVDIGDLSCSTTGEGA